MRWRLELLGRGVAAAGLIAGAELLARSNDLFTDLPRLLAPGAVLALFVVAAVVWPPMVHRRWSYRLAPDALEISRGVVVHRRSAVPYHRVQQVDLRNGPLDRVLGLTSVDLTTAAATSNGSVPGLRLDDAEQFRRLVIERSGRDDAV